MNSPTLPQGERNGPTLTEAAQAYAGRGWAVLPLHSVREGRCSCPLGAACQSAGKHPRTAHGVNDATMVALTIGEWWRRWPDANVGIAVGTVSGLDVLDVDPRHGGDESLRGLEQKHGELPQTITALTGGGGTHFYFRHTPGLKNQASEIGPGLDFKTDGGFVVAVPSVHQSGRNYSWEGAGHPADVGLADPPAWLVARLRSAGAPNPAATARPVDDKIPRGRRNQALTSVAGTLRRRGMDEVEITTALQAVNERRCDPPLLIDEIRSIAQSVARYAAAAPVVAPPNDSGLSEVLNTFSRWLYMPDMGPLEATLATVAANQMDGDPLWLMLVGAPGSGKTETLNAVRDLPNMHMAATITEAALLSGTPKREKAKDARGGLLREIGDFGFLLLKDFTSILSMHRETRGALLAALREVYDGSWTRHVGVDGGRALAWSGKLGLIAGCTPTLDGHHAVMASMGERFLLYRLPPTDPKAQAKQALRHAGHEAEMRRELSASVSALFANARPPVSIEDLIEGEPESRLIALATLAVRCRSAVERDGHTREIELIPDAEAPARLALALARLYAGMVTIDVPDPELWRVLRKVALDCMPALRKAVFDCLMAKAQPAETTAVALEIRYPTVTTRRALEDLAAHGVVRRVSGGKGKPDLWELAAWVLSDYRAAGFPEKSGDILTA